MVSARKQKGFTLIEIVMVLVLLGILATVAISKYYDLRDKAIANTVDAYASQFCADINGRMAELMLEKKTCAEAQKAAFSEIGRKYLFDPMNKNESDRRRG